MRSFISRGVRRLMSKNPERTDILKQPLARVRVGLQRCGSWQRQSLPQAAGRLDGAKLSCWRELALNKSWSTEKGPRSEVSYSFKNSRESVNQNWDCWIVVYSSGYHWLESRSKETHNFIGVRFKEDKAMLGQSPSDVRVVQADVRIVLPQSGIS